MGPYSKKETQFWLDTIVPELFLQQSKFYQTYTKVKDRERENAQEFSGAFRINYIIVVHVDLYHRICLKFN